MKLLATITALLLTSLLYGQSYEATTAGNRSTEEGSEGHRRKTRIYDVQFDRIDYVYKNNLLLYALQHNGGGGFPRTWKYYYHQERSNDILNMLKAKYPNKELFGAVEVTFRNTLIYEVIMQDKKRWYVYQVDTLGGVNLKKQFRKR